MSISPLGIAVLIFVISFVTSLLGYALGWVKATDSGHRRALTEMKKIAKIQRRFDKDTQDRLAAIRRREREWNNLTWSDKLRL